MARISTLLAVVFLSGCVAMSIGELEETGVRRSWYVEGVYTDVSSCLIEWLEREDPGKNIIHLGIGHALHYRELPSQKRVEIQQRPRGNVYFYKLTLQPATESRTLVNFLVEPLSPKWKIEALLRGLRMCGGGIVKDARTLSEGE